MNRSIFRHPVLLIRDMQSKQKCSFYANRDLRQAPFCIPYSLLYTHTHTHTINIFCREILEIYQPLVIKKKNNLVFWLVANLL